MLFLHGDPDELVSAVADGRTVNMLDLFCYLTLQSWACAPTAVSHYHVNGQCRLPPAGAAWRWPGDTDSRAAAAGCGLVLRRAGRRAASPGRIRGLRFSIHSVRDGLRFD